jgi:hypothetical protein
VVIERAENERGGRDRVDAGRRRGEAEGDVCGHALTFELSHDCSLLAVGLPLSS